ncbi:MAG: hypothetical protein ABEJ72_08340, partial [Candidatus Aenigmatarchaeota archaeon]
MFENMEACGVATAVAVVSVLAVAGASVGTPVAVDTYADQKPDGNLYALEKAGESIERAVTGKPNVL